MLARAVIIIAAAVTKLAAQNPADTGLATLLADDQTRDTGVRVVVTSGTDNIPLLLSWARTPPPKLDDFQQYILRISLAQIFGQLKIAEAIPFLIKNISLLDWPLVMPNVWMKTPQVIEQRMPAVSALIRIGPEALDALMDKTWGAEAAGDRLAAIFVVARIAAATKDPQMSEKAREFLLTSLREANLQRHWAQEGLSLLEK